jgi:hypothetical protein
MWSNVGGLESKKWTCRKKTFWKNIKVWLMGHSCRKHQLLHLVMSNL